VSEITKQDRNELAQVVRLRCKVARNGIEARKAELLADFDQQLATIYEFDDERWARITRAAREGVDAADEKLRAVCDEVGIPTEFRPRLQAAWYGRGENALAQRRVELRRAAVSRLDAACQSPGRRGQGRQSRDRPR
jgi:hypothetical protein